jgi:5-methylcytosine-specific restriction endonuclease McrA
MEKRALVLTSWYMPVRIVTWQDAITDLVQGKVEPLVNYSEEIRSPSTVIRCPAVVRILRPTKGMKKGIKFSKQNVAARDGHRCQYCLVRLTLSQITYDHVFPRSRGGETNWDNIVTACRPCNFKKEDKTPQEAGMKLHSIPRKPGSLPVEPLPIMGDMPDEWMAWVK